MIKLVTIAILVAIIFWVGSVYFLRLSLKSRRAGKKLFSEARLGNLFLSFFLGLVGVLFLIFFVKNNDPSIFD